MPIPTHRIAICAGMLIAAIPLQDLESDAATAARLEAAVADESKKAGEEFAVEDWHDVVLLTDDDDVPEGWRVVYTGSSMGWLPLGATMAITEA